MSINTVLCLRCGANCCGHIQMSRKNMLSPAQRRIVHALCNPEYCSHKNIAHALGLAVGTVKVYLTQIYRRLGWQGGSTRQIVLWAFAHREELGIEFPSKDHPAFADLMQDQDGQAA